MLNKSVDENILQIKPDVFECDTDWFENTCPSIKETHLFLPDWEDAEDLEWVTMYFIAEKYDELLQNNDNVLCREAKLFLLNFKEMKETKQPSEVVSKLQMRKLVCDLQKRKSCK
ncbi:MAG: hypothetical protein RBT65_14845 [Methanolobus sp.]|jgi:hypothetical protein|nr:hypothetical protein [Methanolobus sp.]